MRIYLLTIILLANTILFAQNTANKKIFTDSHIKKVMKKAACWQLENPKHKLYDWTNGAFYAGLFACYEITSSNKIYKAMLDMGEKNEWRPGPALHFADDHAICQTYIDLYRLEKKPEMIKAFTQTLENILTTPYPAKDIQQIMWWWCDALFMAPPAFVKLGVTLNDPRFLELNDKLYLESYNLLYDKTEKLFARDLRYKPNNLGIKVITEQNGEKVFWSRGNSWVMAGLVKILKELPESHPTRDFYIQLFKEMAERVSSLQQPDGLWRVSLLDPESYPGGEASGSGFFCYALAWGINNQLLDRETYLPTVEKSWIGLNSLLQEDGRVGWVQPKGIDPKKNFSAESWEVFGTGAFLLAGSEVIKLN